MQDLCLIYEDGSTGLRPKTVYIRHGKTAPVWSFRLEKLIT